MLGFWSPNEDRLVDEQSWNGFKSELNNWYNLDWDISDRVTQVNFMDLTIKIVGNRIEMTLYEKPMALLLEQVQKYSGQSAGRARGRAQLGRAPRGNDARGRTDRAGSECAGSRPLLVG